jgi:glutamate dehydrogenase
MAPRADQLKSELIERVIERVNSRLSGPRARTAVRFVRDFYANVASEDVVAETPDDLYGAALSLWGFAETREAGKAKVRVFNPRVEEHDWHSAHTIVEVVNDDMPFLVDSVTAALSRMDAPVHLIIHPILRVERDGEGRLKKLCEDGAKGVQGTAESFMHIAVSEQGSDRLEGVRNEIADVLANVRAAVEDWPAMRAQAADVLRSLKKTPPPVSSGETEEAISFLRWLDQDHFTFLGYREYDFSGSGSAAAARIPRDNGLGVLRDSSVVVFEALRNLGKLPAEIQAFVRQPNLLRITKANARSKIHRPVHLDTVAVKKFDAKGRVCGERLFVGLFTSGAYSQSAQEIPLLSRKVRRILQRAGFSEASHDGKALMHILDTFPRDDLFQIGEDDLFEISLGILHLRERQKVALFVNRDPFERFVSCLVYAPRDTYDTTLRQRFQKILANAFGGHVVAFSTQMTESLHARLHVIIRTKPGKTPGVDLSDLEARLMEATRTWRDHLRDALIEARGEEAGLAALRRFGSSFPAGYSDVFNAHTAVFDLGRIEQALETDDLAMNLYRPIEAAEDEVCFKLYKPGKPAPLSDILPMLEHMGFRVVSDLPFEITPEDSDISVWIHDFYMRTRDCAEIDVGRIKEKFHDAFARIWHGEMENDGFNRLVTCAGLDAREVTILRAYCKFLRQAKIPFSQEYMEDTLALNPGIARLLVELFKARFDPAADSGEKIRGADIVTAIEARLENVANLDEDRILRRFLNVIQASLRTNFYQTGPDDEPKAHLSIKLDSKSVEELPLPRPFREIFVYSPRIEGVHLRFGKVARGGLRWSDRREDFRTEILGLVKAQQVKNAVIVPVGSKGGFVVKRPPPADAGREAALNEGIECYKTLVRGLLDLTDNLAAGHVVPPPEVVRHDADDPYLVVAADKGTATFSDIANGVSAEYGFWLDDAFASGGSAGYDHKKMGITARGAWESVKRHFREIGKNIQEEDFTVVGVGDMAGDVFGNGMLLSTHIKLVGAFNHLHVFVDPDPDPETSWAERKRLFERPRSAWSDYNTKLISKGGGVFDRKAKSVSVTPQMKAAFGIESDKVTPNELILALLKAEVDLLWFGGIGTYVKSHDETNAEVGDRANDALRVNARELRCSAVGEGANLAVTQRGRIEFALKGGRINTDATDNSAGVDCSDHEVNIKILLGDVEASGDMTRKQRDRLLVKMTEEVAELVLRDNYLQTQALSVTEVLAPGLLDRHALFMRALERAGHLDRAIEYLPDEEALGDRKSDGRGLTRPELAVLLAYAKITLYDALLSSDLPDDPFMVNDRLHYFPKPLRKRYRDQIERHRLHREISAELFTNELINREGITFVHEVREKTGASESDIGRAYMIGREVFSIRSLWHAIEALDNQAPALLQAELLIECGRFMERMTTWFLRNGRHPLDITGEIDLFSGDVANLTADMGAVLTEYDLENLAARTKSYFDRGAPEPVAHRVASLGWLIPACDIVRLSQSSGMAAEAVARSYYRVGDRFGFDWLRHAAARLPIESHWDKQAVVAIVDDLYGNQRDLTGRVIEAALVGGNGEKPPDVDVEGWSAGQGPVIQRTENLFAELRSAGSVDLSMLAVANRQLRAMIG